MSSQYDVLRDHIADFLIFLSCAPSFWFSLNTSYDHGCHLDNQFQMSAQEYESLLAPANLAAYTKSGFIMKPYEWGIFLGGHHFRLSECNIELDKKKFNIDAMINGTTASWDNRRPFYTVWIGVMSLQSPSKIELQKDTRNGLLITTPPRLNGLGIKTQSFWRIADPFIWNFILENSMDEEDKASLPHHHHHQWQQR